MKNNRLTAEELRKSILQLAIQGKLVKQDPNDEPASVLVEKIYEEKKRLIAEGKIKKDKQESYIYKGDDNRYYEKIGKEVIDITDDLPFDIPENWTWMRHNSIFEIFGGSQPPKSKFIQVPKNGYIRLYQIRDYGPNPDPIYIPIETAYKTTKKGDILLARYGASIGKVFIAEDGAYNVAMAKVEKLYIGNYILNDFLLLYYKSNIYQKLVKNNSRSAQAGFNKEDLNALFFPIPPIAEQIRIINKLNSLEPNITRYELVENELFKLDSEIKDKLKKSILQYAIQGKLVKQDPNDEPASILLERIKAEKEQLIKEGKIKRDKNDSIIYQGDDKNYYENIYGQITNITDILPLDIPENWIYVRIDTIFFHNTGKALNSSKTSGEKKKYITTSNLYWNYFVLDNLKEMHFTKNELEKCAVTKGDLLVCEGGDIGRAAVWNYDFPMQIQNHIHKLRKRTFLSVDFYYYVFFLYKSMGLIGGKGIGIQGLSSNALGSIIVPFPSPAEQERIVLRLNTIFNMLK